MKRSIALRTLALTGTALGAFAQDYDLFLKRKPDIGIFGGFQGWRDWHAVDKSIDGGELVKGGLLGARAGWDLNKRWGLETAYTYGVNNLRLFPQDSNRTLAFGARNHSLGLNPVFHFTGPASMVRPFVTAGAGGMWFKPTGSAKDIARRPDLAALGTGRLDDKFSAAFNYGGGVKVNLNRLLQFRLDARNVLTPFPHFILPGAAPVPGGVYISPRGWASGLQLTGGVGLRLGGVQADTSSKGFKLTLSTDGAQVPVGTSRAIKASTDLPGKITPKYEWTLNGAKTGDAGNSLTVTPPAPGDYQVCAVASAARHNATSECLTLTAVDSAKKDATLTLTANPPAVIPGATAAVTAASNAGEGARYAWTVNGQPVDETGANYTFRTDGKAPGNYEVCSTVSAAAYSSSKQCTTVTVRECGKPEVTVAQSAGEVFSGEKAELGFRAAPNACGSPVALNYSATEGTVAAGPNGAVFDSSSVAFDMANRSKLQRKTVTVTATARDAQGNTAASESKVIVKLRPAAQRLDDLIFAQGSSRVNNCAKRLLLEVLAPRLQQDPSARVVLVGYIDESEKTASRLVRTKSGKRVRRVVTGLDRSRVLNAAAVIGAGKGICASIEMDRIKVSFAGTSQGSEPRPAFCGSSATPRTTGISASDKRMPHRRVEVWIVPEGAEMPAGPASDAPAVQIKALGCPR